MAGQIQSDRLQQAATGPQDRVTVPARGTKFLVGAIAIVFVAIFAWGFFGTIKTTVSGDGIIIRKHQQVFVVQGTWGGKIAKINVQVGDSVTAGQVLVELENPRLQTEIDAVRRRLVLLQENFASYQADLDLEVEAFEATVGQQLAALAESQSALQSLLHNLDSEPRETDPSSQRALVPADTDPELEGERLRTRTALLEAEIDRTVAQAESARFQALVTEKLASWRQTIAEQQLRLRELEDQLETARFVVSPATGIVGEILENTAQNVGPQNALLTVISGGPGFEVLAFLHARDAPRAEPGLPVRVAPATSRRGAYGTIRGTVTHVSEAPLSTAKINKLLRNEELSVEFAQYAQPYLCRIELFESASTPSGFAWWRGQGAPFPITVGTRVGVDIVIEDQAPITLLLPFLRSVTYL